MKRKILSLSMLAILGLSANAQTPVSGGIYSSTTWTLAGSPYIVTDTVVVFPNDTLTIQPGVIVKFDNNIRLELRQATLIAQGTAMDSITFTSNAATPYDGIWSSIYFNGENRISKFNYCNFYYAKNGICGYSMNYDTITINHSRFCYNNIGLGYIYYYNYVFVDSCLFKNNVNGIKSALMGIRLTNSIVINNQNGILSPEESSYFNCKIDSNSVIGISTEQEDTIIDCTIKYNGIGFLDSTSGGGRRSFITRNIIDNNNIGIRLGFWSDTIYCNKICNNTLFDLCYTFNVNTNCVEHNYWCTPDSASTEAVIYDGYDNIHLGLVSFMPMDTIGCYLTTGIAEPLIYSENNISIYPNPATDNLTIDVSATLNIPATIEITNIEGQVIKQQITNAATTNLVVSALAKGMYFVKVRTEKGVAVKKFIKE